LAEALPEGLEGGVEDGGFGRVHAWKSTRRFSSAD